LDVVLSRLSFRARAPARSRQDFSPHSLPDACARADDDDDKYGRADVGSSRDAVDGSAEAFSVAVRPEDRARPAVSSGRDQEKKRPSVVFPESVFRDGGTPLRDIARMVSPNDDGCHF